MEEKLRKIDEERKDKEREEYKEKKENTKK